MAIVDETVLRRPVGGVEVMRGQLRHLVSQAALPSVCFQVVPVSIGAHQGMNGSFTVLNFTESDEPTIVYTEDAVSAARVRKEADVRAYLTGCDPRR